MTYRDIPIANIQHDESNQSFESLFSNLENARKAMELEFQKTLPLLQDIEQVVLDSSSQGSLDSPMKKQEDFYKLKLKLAIEKKKELLCEREKLMYQLEANVNEFNHEINELNYRRCFLLSDLKMLEMKLLNLNEEYHILLTFEEKDTSLNLRKNKILQDKQEISLNVLDLQEKINQKLLELNEYSKKLIEIESLLKSILPESIPSYDILMKIFKKRIKRHKKIYVNTSSNTNTLDNSLEGDSMLDGSMSMDYESEEDDDDSFHDDDNNDDEEVEDMCPQGYEQVSYDKILSLREKRLDIEEAISDVNKGLEESRKLLERSKQREKQVVKDCNSIELEIQQFQLQKLHSLNQIPIVVPLKLSQVFALKGSGSGLGLGLDEDNSLDDVNKRNIIENIDNHILISNQLVYDYINITITIL